MILKEKERSVIEDLQTQEKSCVEKYGKYAEQARDPELKIFSGISSRKNRSIMSLCQWFFPEVCLNVTVMTDQAKTISQKQSIQPWVHRKINNTMPFLQRIVSVQKLVSGTYNDDVFAFGDSGVRKLLADIQIEEQNHAEMLYKYKTVNGMA